MAQSLKTWENHIRRRLNETIGFADALTSRGISVTTVARSIVITIEGGGIIGKIEIGPNPNKIDVLQGWTAAVELAQILGVIS